MNKDFSYNTQQSSATSLIPKRFYLLRHGQTQWNVLGRCQGWRDIPLNETGRKQALSIKNACALLPITHIFYSPLSRASETMSIACERLSCPRAAIEHLKEWHIGDWQGNGIPWNDEKVWYNAPLEGESRQQFLERTLIATNSVLAQADVPLLVVHSGTFRALCLYAKISFEKSIKNAELVLFTPPDTLAGWRYELIISPLK